MNGVWVDHWRLMLLKSDRSLTRTWPHDTRLLQLPDAQVRVRDVGSGNRTILLSPDAPAVLENYSALIDLLAPHARVVCFEFPGCGFSYPRRGFRFSLGDYVRIVEAIMDQLTVGRATLAFTCVNAMVAMAFAKAHPERVERLCLSQVACVSEMHAFARRIDVRLGRLRLLRTPVLGQIVNATRRINLARTWFETALAPGSDVEAIWKCAAAVYAAGGEFCLASLIQGQAQIRPEDVGEVTCPTTVVWGDADRTHKRTDKDSIRQQVPEARLMHLSHLGHCPDLEAPDLYSEFLLRPT